MDIALVTGAATGVGLAVARKLVDLGCRVYGLGGNYQDIAFRHPAFIPVPCDLTSPADVQDKVKGILEREGGLYIVVNNAKVYPSRPLAEADPRELDISVRVNVLAPLLILRHALPSLQKFRGYVINICSTRPETSRGGAAGAATDAAIHRLGEALFDELRGSGVRVTTLFPQTNRYRPADAGPPPRHNPQSVIDPLAVADAVERVVTHRDGNVITEIILRPLLLKEEPQPGAYVVPAPPPPPLEQPTEVRERALAERLARTAPNIRAALERARTPQELEEAAKHIDDEEDDGDFPEVDEKLRRIDEEFGRGEFRDRFHEDDDDDAEEDADAAAAARLRHRDQEQNSDRDDDDDEPGTEPGAESGTDDAGEGEASRPAEQSEQEGGAKRRKRRRRRGRGKDRDRNRQSAADSSGTAGDAQAPPESGSESGASDSDSDSDSDDGNDDRDSSVPAARDPGESTESAPGDKPANAPSGRGRAEFGPEEDTLEDADLKRLDGPGGAEQAPSGQSGPDQAGSSTSSTSSTSSRRPRRRRNRSPEPPKRPPGARPSSDEG